MFIVLTWYCFWHTQTIDIGLKCKYGSRNPWFLECVHTDALVLSWSESLYRIHHDEMRGDDFCCPPSACPWRCWRWNCIGWGESGHRASFPPFTAELRRRHRYFGGDCICVMHFCNRVMHCRICFMHCCTCASCRAGSYHTVLVEGDGAAVADVPTDRRP